MESFLFGTSPTTVSAPPIVNCQILGSTEDAISFDEFIESLPYAINSRKQHGLQAGSKEDPILQLFERLNLNAHQDWKAYAHFDTSRHYTRNLIATDHTNYTLLLLCWNPGQESPIHDHPCDGCWMQVLQGQIQECRYHARDEDQQLKCTQDKTFDEGGTVFIEDSLGLHKVGNPGKVPAVTLHLYAPPFASCKIWLDETRQPSKSSICNYSEYGRLV